MKLNVFLTAAAFTTFTVTASAQEIGDTFFGVGVTNFGLALQGEYTVNPNLNIRGAIMGGLSLDDEFEVEDYTVDGTADFGGLSIVADYYPFENAWRISGGLFFSNSEITGDFTGPEDFDGKVKFANEVAPLITTGFRTELASGWALSGDIGVIISPLEASSSDTSTAVQDEIDALNDDIEDIPVFPYIGTAVSYRF